MDLKNERITLGELWDDPKAREVFRRRFPLLTKNPIKNRARTITVGQLADFLSSWVSENKIREVLRELERL